jgi:glycosyltransferase involved in cell wall biosynthesis
MAHNYLGLIALTQKDFETSRDHFILAIREKPQFPTWYVNLAYLYALEKNYDEATHYLRMFVNTPSPKTSTVKVPIDDEMRYYRALYLVAIGKRKIKEAISAAQEMVERSPHNKEAQKQLKAVERLDELVEITKGVKAIGLELERDKDDLRIQTLLNALPESIADNAYVEQLRQKYLKPKKWKTNTIVYYTGPTFEEWTPDSIKTGLGGSETAVVRLSEQWAKKGYNVTVYANTGAGEGVYNGVTYKNWYRFNQKDTFDTLILWRSVTLLDVPYKANRIWLDLHDVPNPNEYTAERIENVDRIFVKSNYHRSLISHVPDHKFSVITNGVDVKYKNKRGKRDPYKLIYASSYDRGLEQMLAVGWPIIKKEVPEATLDIYYGWNMFDAVHRNNPERMQWKKKMRELMSQDGVTEHGRIGHEELMEKKAISSIHYYTTDFEEIDCISVRESALVGCIPVTTDYAALKEKPYGVKIPGDPRSRETQEKAAEEIIKLLIKGIPDNTRNDAIVLASKESWKEVADQWISHTQ